MFERFGKWVKGAALAMVAVASGATFTALTAPAADATGMADGVVTVITAANADVLLIGAAILALCVLIASIAWFKRATNK